MFGLREIIKMNRGDIKMKTIYLFVNGKEYEIKYDREGIIREISPYCEGYEERDISEVLEEIADRQAYLRLLEN